MTLTLVIFTFFIAAGAAVAARPSGRAADLADVQRLERVFAEYRSPLAGTGRVFVAAGRANRVSPFLVAAIAGNESTFGRQACHFNAWGIASCRRSYRSWAEGIWSVSRLLRDGYLSRGLTTIRGIAYRWCPPSTGCDTERWIRNLSWLMRRAFGVPDWRLDS